MMDEWMDVWKPIKYTHWKMVKYEAVVRLLVVVVVATCTNMCVYIYVYIFGGYYVMDSLLPLGDHKLNQ